MSSTRQWMKFFLDAGIPPESSAQYAVTFESNRMGLDMLADLDKEYLRDLNITALGDIISILKHAKDANARSAADEVLKTEKNKEKSHSDDIKSKILKPSSRSVSEVPRKKEDQAANIKYKAVKPEVVFDQPSSPPAESFKSVFSRLGDQQSDDSEVDVKDTELKLSKRLSNSGSIFERLGPESARSDQPPSPQEASVTSTTSASDLTPQLPRGILKKRGTGDGLNLARSKSASNIISLKAPIMKDAKREKRISFGENEIKTMEPKLDIKSRLGYGKCSSPPPPEISEPTLKTEIKKIAIGGGKFEMRKVMKAVDKTIASELGKIQSTSVSNEPKVENLSVALKNDVEKKPLKVAIKNEYANEEYNVDKVDLALRAAKLKSVPYQAREGKSPDTERSPRKRLAKYITKPDGTVEKHYIDYDDPILKTQPIKKKKSEDLDQMIRQAGELKVNTISRTPLIIGKEVASNFKVVRSTSSSDDTRHHSDGSNLTLAQKAVLARSKQETTFQTLANRASVVKKRSLSMDEDPVPVSIAKMDEKKLSIKTRLDDKSFESGTSNIRDRVGSKDREKSYGQTRERVRSRDRSPISIKDRVGVKENSRKERVSFNERVSPRKDHARERESRSSSRENKIFSRLGPRD